MLFTRSIATVALALMAAGTVQAASQEEWANPAPNAIVSQGSQVARVATQAQLVQGERPDYLMAPAGQLSRGQVRAETQRWMNDGLRQFGAGEGGALYYQQTRNALSSFVDHKG